MADGATSVQRYDRDQLAPYQEVLVRWVAAAPHVLELGPSTGYMSQAMRDTHSHVTAVEVDRDALRVLADRADVALWGDLDRLETVDHLAGSHYDVVVLADVLEHLRDPAAVLRAVHGWLGPGGRVLVSMPNVAYWRVRADLARGRWTTTRTGILDETHLRFFTRATAEQLFTGAGLAVVRWQSVWWEVPFDHRVRTRAAWAWPVKERLNAALRHRRPEVFASQFLWELTPAD